MEIITLIWFIEVTIAVTIILALMALIGAELWWRVYRSIKGGIYIVDSVAKYKQIQAENKKLKSILESIYRHASNAAPIHQIKVMAEEALKGE